MNHLFLDCIVSPFIWRAVPWPIMIERFASHPMTTWISVIFNPAAIEISSHDHHFFQLYAVNAIDFVWIERNQIVHGAWYSYCCSTTGC